MAKKFDIILLGGLGFVVSAAAWEGLSVVIHNPGLFPPLGRVGAAAEAWAADGTFGTDLMESLPRAWLSIILALPSGAALGILLGVSRVARWTFEPTLNLARSLPPGRPTSSLHLMVWNRLECEVDHVSSGLYLPGCRN